MTQTVYNALLNADKLLDTISVSGSDAYALVEARRLMKAAFDELAASQEVKEGESIG